MQLTRHKIETKYQQTNESDETSSQNLKDYEKLQSLVIGRKERKDLQVVGKGEIRIKDLQLEPSYSPGNKWEYIEKGTL